MADSGFYYTPTKAYPDQVTCFWCKKKEHDLNEIESISDLHHKNTPDCPFSTITMYLEKFVKSSNKATFWHRLEGVAKENITDPLSEESVLLRLSTFGDMWKIDDTHKSKVTARGLAEAGFYYSPVEMNDDRVICMYCDCPLSDWDPEDDPIVEHKKNRFEFCYFLDEYEKSLHFKKEKAKKFIGTSDLSPKRINNINDASNHSNHSNVGNHSNHSNFGNHSNHTNYTNRSPSTSPAARSSVSPKENVLTQRDAFDFSIEELQNHEKGTIFEGKDILPKRFARTRTQPKRNISKSIPSAIESNKKAQGEINISNSLHSGSKNRTVQEEIERALRDLSSDDDQVDHSNDRIDDFPPVKPKLHEKPKNVNPRKSKNVQTSDSEIDDSSERGTEQQGGDTADLEDDEGDEDQEEQSNGDLNDLEYDSESTSASNDSDASFSLPETSSSLPEKRRLTPKSPAAAEKKKRKSLVVPRKASQFDDDDDEFGLDEVDIERILNSPKKSRKVKVIQKVPAVSPSGSLYENSNQNLGDYDEENLSFLEKNIKSAKLVLARAEKVKVNPGAPGSKFSINETSKRNADTLEASFRVLPSEMSVIDTGQNNDDDPEIKEEEISSQEINGQDDLNNNEKEINGEENVPTSIQSHPGGDSTEGRGNTQSIPTRVETDSDSFRFNTGSIGNGGYPYSQISPQTMWSTEELSKLAPQQQGEMQETSIKIEASFGELTPTNPEPLSPMRRLLQKAKKLFNDTINDNMPFQKSTPGLSKNFPKESSPNDNTSDGSQINNNSSPEILSENGAPDNLPASHIVESIVYGGNMSQVSITGSEVTKKTPRTTTASKSPDDEDESNFTISASSYKEYQRDLEEMDDEFVDATLLEDDLVIESKESIEESAHLAVASSRETGRVLPQELKDDSFVVGDSISELKPILLSGGSLRNGNEISVEFPVVTTNRREDFDSNLKAREIVNEKAISPETRSLPPDYQPRHSLNRGSERKFSLPDKKATSPQRVVESRSNSSFGEHIRDKSPSPPSRAPNTKVPQEESDVPQKAETSLSALSFDNIDASTPQKPGKPTSTASVARFPSSVDPSRQFPHISLDFALSQVKTLEEAIERMSELTTTKFDLHNDDDGYLTEFIAAMPEKEENMTIQDWILENSSVCENTVTEICERIIVTYLEDFEKLIVHVENLVTSD